MKHIFVCEICLCQYRLEAEAVACEAVGFPKTSQFPPIGLIVGPGKKFAGFHFVVQHTAIEGHRFDVRFGAFRPEGPKFDAFDFLTPEAAKGFRPYHMGPCVAVGDDHNWKDWPEPDTTAPTFLRAMKALREVDITPVFLRDGQLYDAGSMGF